MKRNNYVLKRVYVFLSFLMLAQIADAQKVSTFEDLMLAPESYWDGNDGTGGFTSGEAYFYNMYNAEYSFGEGFMYSNQTDKTTEGYGNSFSAYTGKGYWNSDNYAIAYNAPLSIKLQQADTITGFFVTNTTYAALSMKNGDSYARKFGGDTGDDKDWFKLTITGYLGKVKQGNPIDFYLADYRYEDNRLDYILDTWKWVDLSGLGNIDSLTFTLSSSDEGMYGMNTPAYFAMDNFNDPLFAPAAGIEGTTAIHKDNPAFVGWATACHVERGLQDISNPSSGKATAGDPEMVVGKPGVGIVSLGDGGVATLTFAHPIINGPGYDFAVFENGFDSKEAAFLELAFVEVSSNGVNFFRFPSISHTSDTLQKNNDGVIDARMIHNLAGKYVANYGTPFDLEELKDQAGLDLDNITHVRIIDVVGSVYPDYAGYDAHGNRINDPWPTPFPSSGFDLAGIGVIHSSGITSLSVSWTQTQLDIYPNPSYKNQEITISQNRWRGKEQTLHIFDFSGRLILTKVVDHQKVKISTENMTEGIYFVKVMSGEEVETHKLIIH